MSRVHWAMLAATAALLGFALLIGGGAAALHPAPKFASFTLPSIVLYFVGFLLGVLWLRIIAASVDSAMVSLIPVRKLFDVTLVTATVVGLVYLGITAAISGSAPPLKIAVVFVLIVASLLSGFRCLEALGRGEAIGIESHWGGLGGGGGGWRLLPATAMFFLTLTFASAAIIVALIEPMAQQPVKEKPSSSATVDNATADNAAADNAVTGNATAPAGNATEPAT